MIKKVIKFFDHHRVILVLTILFVISALFIGINSYFFFHHDFIPSSCTSDHDEEYCYHEDTLILKDPEKKKEEIFEEYREEIEKLQEDYHLEDFSFYTAYYYEVASKINYEITGKDEELQKFFLDYANTYNLHQFFIDYNFYFNLYYHYKIN